MCFAITQFYVSYFFFHSPSEERKSKLKQKSDSEVHYEI